MNVDTSDIWMASFLNVRSRLEPGRPACKRQRRAPGSSVFSLAAVQLAVVTSLSSFGLALALQLSNVSTVAKEQFFVPETLESVLAQTPKWTLDP